MKKYEISRSGFEILLIKYQYHYYYIIYGKGVPGMPQSANQLFMIIDTAAGYRLIKLDI